MMFKVEGYSASFRTIINNCNKVHKTRIMQTVYVSLQTRWTLIVIIVPHHKKQDRKTHSVQLLRWNRPAVSTGATTDVPRNMSATYTHLQTPPETGEI